MWNICVVDSCRGWKGAFVGQRHADFRWFLSDGVERTLVVFRDKSFSMGMLLLQALYSHLYNNHHYYSNIYDISSDIFIFLKMISWGVGGNGWNKWHRWGNILSYDGNQLLNWYKIHLTPKGSLRFFVPSSIIN